MFGFLHKSKRYCVTVSPCKTKHWTNLNSFHAFGLKVSHTQTAVLPQVFPWCQNWWSFDIGYVLHHVQGVPFKMTKMTGDESGRGCGEVLQVFDHCQYQNRGDGLYPFVPWKTHQNADLIGSIQSKMWGLTFPASSATEVHLFEQTREPPDWNGLEECNDLETLRSETGQNLGVVSQESSRFLQ